MEFVNGLPKNYNFGDGRIYWNNNEDGTAPAPNEPPLGYQYRITDHLGNTMAYFEDRDQNGTLTTEEDTIDPDLLEVHQRLWYYPFGMQMDGIVRPDMDSKSGGPNKRYVKDPKTGYVIDMYHFLMAGQFGERLGNAKEYQQRSESPNSAHHPQDYFSNALGVEFMNAHTVGVRGPLPSRKTTFNESWATSLRIWINNR